MNLPAPPLNNKYRVLIVEDDASILKLLSMHLGKIGFDCLGASDGLEGWSEFQKFDPHLVLSDISMPGMNGHELTNHIRAQSNVPVILMTAENTGDNEMQGFKSGADDYVSKPFNPQLLVARVAANLRRVYRYDVPVAPPKVRAAPAAAPSIMDEKPVPDGWSKCDNCGYMGPQFKFQGLDLNGRPIFVCPHCKNTSITFSLG